MTVEEELMEIEAEIKCALTRVKGLIKETEGSRELSLTRTKLEEALMWFKTHRNFI